MRGEQTRPATDDTWISDWLDSVVSGRAAMSQRAVSLIEKHGGLDVAVAMARRKASISWNSWTTGGKVLVAASLNPFKTLC